MPDQRRDKTSETEVDSIKETLSESRAVAGRTGEAAVNAFLTAGSSTTDNLAVTERTKDQPVESRLVFRDGVAYLDGCDVPVWRLEMARRAGSSADSQIRLFPSLTRQGLDLAFAYAQEHSAEFDPLIQYHSGASVPPEDEGDDEDDATFEAELDALLERDAELLRRLAQ